VGFKRGVTWHTLPFKKKNLGVVASFREQICKNHMRQMWAGKNKNRPISGFFSKITNVQVILFQLKFPQCIFQSTSLKIKHLEKLFVKYYIDCTVTLLNNLLYSKDHGHSFLVLF
jgi:hypothetical protein